MLLIGDVHGKLDAYLRLIKNESESLQLGDMGVGFPGVDLPVLEGDHWFIRGNHDDPAACASHPRYFGDWGLRTMGDTELFFISGAYSVDREVRTEGKDWWREEELEYGQLREMIADFTTARPKIVVSHDCPQSVPIRREPILTSRTALALQAAFEEWQPERWIFAHMHHSWRQTVNGTKFQCLNELETVRI